MEVRVSVPRRWVAFVVKHKDGIQEKEVCIFSRGKSDLEALVQMGSSFVPQLGHECLVSYILRPYKGSVFIADLKSIQFVRTKQD
jgi:hypothetical protein